jgi:hypothetical protein
MLKLTVVSMGLDMFLSVCRLTLRLEIDNHTEDFIYLLQIDSNAKPSAQVVQDWIESCKSNVMCKVETENTCKACEEDKGQVVKTLTVDETPVIPVETIKAKVITPKVVPAPAAKKDKKARAETVETTVVETKQEVLIVNPVVEKAEAQHVDVMFDRKDHTHLAPFTQLLNAKVGDAWKTDKELIEKVKTTLDLITGKWVYTRNGVINAALYRELFISVTKNLEMPAPYVLIADLKDVNFSN